MVRPRRRATPTSLSRLDMRAARRKVIALHYARSASAIKNSPADYRKAGALAMPRRRGDGAKMAMRGVDAVFSMPSSQARSQ